MSVSATEARNRWTQLLEQARREPVFIEKAGRPHSVLLSIEQYERLRLAAPPGAAEPAPSSEAMPAASHGPQATAFYEKYKDWVDAQNEHFERHGIFGQEYRQW